MSTADRHSQRSNPRAFTMVEAAVCTVVVGLMLAASLNASGAARARQQRNQDRTTGLWLAHTLMTEIMEKPYVDSGGTLGLELGESRAQRTTLDDVDDYDGLNEQPPRNKDGSTISGYNHWSRSVVVEYVLASNPRTKSLSETNLKRITVTIKKNGVTMSQLRALRSRARDAW